MKTTFLGVRIVPGVVSKAEYDRLNFEHDIAKEKICQLNTAVEAGQVTIQTYKELCEKQQTQIEALTKEKNKLLKELEECDEPAIRL